MIAKRETAIAFPALSARLRPFVVADTKPSQSLALRLRHIQSLRERYRPCLKS